MPVEVIIPLANAPSETRFGTSASGGDNGEDNSSSDDDGSGDSGDSGDSGGNSGSRCEKMRSKQQAPGHVHTRVSVAGVLAQY